MNWHLDCPNFEDVHINVKEVLAAVYAAQYWGPEWANQKVIVFSDNVTTVASINKGTSRNKSIMGLLRYLFWLSAAGNFVIKACHIPGKNNERADAISRLHESSSFWSVLNPMCRPGPWGFPSQTISWAASRFLLCRHSRSADLGSAGCKSDNNPSPCIC